MDAVTDVPHVFEAQTQVEAGSGYAGPVGGALSHSEGDQPTADGHGYGFPIDARGLVNVRGVFYTPAELDRVRRLMGKGKRVLAQAIILKALQRKATNGRRVHHRSH